MEYKSFLMLGVLSFFMFATLVGVSADVLSFNLGDFTKDKIYKSCEHTEYMIIPGDSSELPDVFSFDNLGGISLWKR